jgi:hypothetical protein
LRDVWVKTVSEHPLSWGGFISFCQFLYTNWSQDSSVSIVTGLQYCYDPGYESRQWRTQPAACGILSRVKSGWSVKVTTHLYIMPRWRMSGVLSPLPPLCVLS